MHYMIETKVSPNSRKWGRRFERDETARRKFRQGATDGVASAEILTFTHDPTDFRRMLGDKGCLRNGSLHLDQCGFEVSNITKLLVWPNKTAAPLLVLETPDGMDSSTFNLMFEEAVALPNLQPDFELRLECEVVMVDLPPPRPVEWEDHLAEDPDCFCQDCYDGPPREPYVYVPHITLLVKGMR